MEDRLTKGREILLEMFGPDLFAKRIETTNTFNSDLRDLTASFCYAEIWGRAGLDRRTKSIIVISILASLGRSEELSRHVSAALENGSCSVEDVKEAILVVAAYAGFPAAVSATASAEAVLRAKGIL